MERDRTVPTVENDQDLTSVKLHAHTDAGQSKGRIYLDKLCSLAHPGGGWGFAPDQPAHPEPTCLALLALALERDSYGEATRSGWAFLDRCQSADGSYKASGGRAEALWPTALLLSTQAPL